MRRKPYKTTNSHYTNIIIFLILMRKMKNNNEIRFKCTTEQHDQIKAKALKVGMSIKQYLLYLGLNSEIELKIRE